MSNTVVSTGIYSGVVAIILWLVAMLIVRAINFSREGERRTSVRGGDNRSDQIEYHNTKPYTEILSIFLR